MSERIIKWSDERVRKAGVDKLSTDNMKDAFNYLEEQKYGTQKQVKQPGPIVMAFEFDDYAQKFDELQKKQHNELMRKLDLPARFLLKIEGQFCCYLWVDLC